MSFSADDHRFMARALQLAERGMNTTTPNPRVGCVLVSGGVIIGEGWHERAGEAHAEIAALQSVHGSAKGATAYVTLEPCNHQGRTPPCTEALIAAGVARVVAAMEDPNPQVSGAGAARLRDAGIVIEVGLMAEAARELNIGFVSRFQRRRPWVRIKIAASIDGKTALANGVSQWITGAAARRDGHRWRARSCAVMTGIGTLNDDDPRLTVRDVPAHRQPLRVVVDSRLRVPLDAKILDGGGVVVATAVEDKQKTQQLEALGAQVWLLPDSAKRVELVALVQALAAQGINEVLVEAGRNLHSALLAADVVDEFVLYLAPHFLGDDARGMIELPGLHSLDQRLNLKVRDVRRFGDDFRIIARTGRGAALAGE